jgi:hypothetical protein
MKILQGKPFGVSTANELTIERIESLAADLGAHSIAPYNVPGAPIGYVYAPLKGN